MQITVQLFIKKISLHQLKPIMADDYIFLITKNNLLLAFDLNKGKIIYSYNIDKEISNFLNIKKKKCVSKNNVFIRQ